MPSNHKKKKGGHHEETFLCSEFAFKEKSRYQRKGYGLFVAICIAVGFFLGVPHFGQQLWPYLLKWQQDNQLSDTAVFLIFACGLHNLIHIGANLIYWVFYTQEFSFIERYKSNDSPWPWKEDPDGWRILCYKSIFVLLFNGNVLVPSVYMILDNYKLLEKPSMSIEDLPGPLTLAASITFFMLVEDFVFYWSHRFLHQKFIYPYIHKMHHSHNTTVGIAAEYAHPVEFILGNMLPTSAGIALLGTNVHLLTVLAWYAIRFGETLDGHCGYEFSWSPYRLIPFSGSAEYHDFHHAVNIGNYGSFFSIWDSVFGTNTAFYDSLKDKQRVVSDFNKVKQQ